ncbi:transposase [Patescibacteria group bacterium]|nr:transposase [Patescibacteria group bacterium]
MIYILNMSVRSIKFENGEYYHIYNRGTDKRKIFGDKNDIWRFIKGVLIFNRLNPIGSIREELGENLISRGKASGDFKELVDLSGELVEFVCFCLNLNHYHFLVKQVSDDGISKFMHRLGTGYTGYFNEKNKRSGALFQGKFKAVHIESNEQLLYTSAYVNLNDKIHGINDDDKELVFSSWNEYLGKNKTVNICKGKNMILGQYGNLGEYKEFAESVAESTKDLKKEKIIQNDYLE